nr:hypothetical protein CFP56_52425 [Quercus suber]
MTDLSFERRAPWLPDRTVQCTDTSRCCRSPPHHVGLEHGRGRRIVWLSREKRDRIAHGRVGLWTELVSVATEPESRIGSRHSQSSQKACLDPGVIVSTMSSREGCYRATENRVPYMLADRNDIGARGRSWLMTSSAGRRPLAPKLAHLLEHFSGPAAAVAATALLHTLASDPGLKSEWPVIFLCFLAHVQTLPACPPTFDSQRHSMSAHPPRPAITCILGMSAASMPQLHAEILSLSTSPRSSAAIAPGTVVAPTWAAGATTFLAFPSSLRATPHTRARNPGADPLSKAFPAPTTHPPSIHRKNKLDCE